MPTSETQKTRDAVVEFAKDLLMHDFTPLLHFLDDERAKTDKGAAFHNLVIALHAARAASEAFRKAHLAAKLDGMKNGIRSQMEKDLAEEFKRIDSLAPGTPS